MGRPTRSVTARSVRPTIRAYTEGEKTEVQYLQAWHRLFRDRVVVEIDERHGCVPRQLVEAAVADKVRSARDARRGRGSAPSEFWCVFDRDDHQGIDEAFQLAGANGVQIAFSNPCIELWLLLHYQDHRRWDHRTDVQRILRELTGIDKTLGEDHVAAMIEAYPEARGRAEKLTQMHRGNQSPDNENPSSDLWRLVETIRGAS